MKIATNCVLRKTNQLCLRPSATMWESSIIFSTLSHTFLTEYRFKLPKHHIAAILKNVLSSVHFSTNVLSSVRYLLLTTLKFSTFIHWRVAIFLYPLPTTSDVLEGAPALCVLWKPICNYSISLSLVPGTPYLSCCRTFPTNLCSITLHNNHNTATQRNLSDNHKVAFAAFEGVNVCADKVSWRWAWQENPCQTRHWQGLNIHDVKAITLHGEFIAHMRTLSCSPCNSNSTNFWIYANNYWWSQKLPVSPHFNLIFIRKFQEVIVILRSTNELINHWQVISEIFSEKWRRRIPFSSERENICVVFLVGIAWMSSQRIFMATILQFHNKLFIGIIYYRWLKHHSVAYVISFIAAPITLFKMYCCKFCNCKAHNANFSFFDIWSYLRRYARLFSN